MLVNPKIKYDIQLMVILSIVGQGGNPEELETGIFISPSFSFGNSINNDKNEYFDFQNEDEYLGAYGVCDTIEQVKEKVFKMA